MRTRRHNTVARVLLALLVVAAGLLCAAAPATAAPEVTAADRFAACLNTNKKGDVLLLIDESGSLKKSDADAARVTAGLHLLQRLAAVADAGNIDLTVSLAAFGNRYDALGGTWSSLTTDSLGDLSRKLTDFQNRNRASGTDYWLGLDGARRALAERQDAQGGRCQAVVFFSDGALDIWRANDEDFNPIERPYDPGQRLSSADDRQRATNAAAESLCRVGGLADQVRSAGVIVFGVGLEAASTPGTFDLMRGVVTGQRESGTCGGRTDPVPGQFTTATGIDGLLFAFDGIIAGSEENEAPVCQGEVCEEGAHTIVLDATVSHVDILGTADVEDVRVWVSSPSGERTELERPGVGEERAITLSGVRGTFTWLSGRTVNIALNADGSDAWSGAWQLAFVDPAAGSSGIESRTAISVRGDLTPVWDPATGTAVRADSVTPATFTLTNGKSELVDPLTIPGSASLAVTLVNPDGSQSALAIDLPKEQLAGPVDIGPDLTPGTHTLRLTLNVTTAPGMTRSGAHVPGTALSPVITEYSFEVLPPLGFPTVGGRVDFGHIEGPAKVSVDLPLVGPGCVWLNASGTLTQAAPEGIGSVDVASPAHSADTCVHLKEGQQGALPLTLTTENGSIGGLFGTLDVSAVPTDSPSDQRRVSVPFTADLTKTLNATNWLAALIAALILGPGIPLAVLYLLKYLLASRIPANGLEATEMSITLDGDRVLRDGQDLAFHPEDAKNFHSIPRGGARSVRVGTAVLRARLGASPFGAGFVVVDAPGRVGASDAFPTPHGRQRQAKLPLAVHNHWALLATPGMPTSATLLMLVAGAASPDERGVLIESARAEVPRLMPGLTDTGGNSAQKAGILGGNDPFAAPLGGATSTDDPFGLTDADQDPFGPSSTVSSSDPFGGSGSGTSPAPSAGTSGWSAQETRPAPFGEPPPSFPSDSYRSDDPFR